METTVRNIYKTIFTKKCGAVIMLSNLAENSKVYYKQNKARLPRHPHVILIGMQLSILASSYQRENDDI